MTMYVRHPDDPRAATQAVPSHEDQDALRETSDFRLRWPLLNLISSPLLLLLTNPQILAPTSARAREHSETFNAMVDALPPAGLGQTLIGALAVLLGTLSAVRLIENAIRGPRIRRRWKNLAVDPDLPLTALSDGNSHHKPASAAIGHLAAMESLRSWDEVCEPADRAQVNIEVAQIAQRCVRLGNLASQYDAEHTPQDRLDRLDAIGHALEDRARAIESLVDALKDSDHALGSFDAMPTIESLDEDLATLYAETEADRHGSQHTNTLSANTNAQRDAYREVVAAALGNIGPSKPTKVTESAPAPLHKGLLRRWTRL